MYISRVQLRPDASKSSVFWSAAASEYNTHRQVWRLFGDKKAARDFIYRQEEQRGAVRFFVVSATQPNDPDSLWNLETKDYAPRLRTGQRLAFSLRANAVRTRQDGEGKHHRHDVVMEAKRALRATNGASGEAPMLEIVQREGFAWLAARAQRYGFAIAANEVRVDGYRQHDLRKPKAASLIRFSTLEYTGLLEVLDPGRLVEALWRGIGPGKGFGCGLLLVRPA